MNLSFLNPLFLFALAAGVLPILIHRLTERKGIPKRFSAVRLLLQSQRVRARPQRLKHLLLLALRVLAVLTLVLMTARPVLTRQSLFGAGEAGVRILILDNSLSMGYRDERGERYELAKKAAREILESHKGPVILVPVAPLPGLPAGGKGIRTMGAKEATKELALLPLSFGRGDPAAALAAAYRALKDFKGPREIFILSDLARGDWQGFNLGRLGAVDAEAGLIFIRIGTPERDANLTVRKVALVQGDAVAGAPARLEVILSNFSARPASPLVQLHLAGAKTDQKTVDLPPGQEGRASFELFLHKAGWVNGEIRLTADSLPADDVFYFSLHVREKARVLIVDGDPKTSLKASESYYLARALNPGGSGLEGSPFFARVTTEEEPAELETQNFEALLLLNVSRPSPALLGSFLKAGKPVFFFLGDRVDPEEYNRTPLFPWRLRELQESVSPQGTKIMEVDYRRESLKPFAGLKEDSLKSAVFRRYFKIEGSTENLLKLENGEPLLVQAESGKGRLFLFASSADLDWNDLPLKSAYLPLVQGLLKEALGLHRNSLPAAINFGDSFEEKSTPAQIIGPPGGPGIYQFLTPSGEMRRAVNAPLEESDLSKLSNKELQDKFGKVNVRVVEYKEGALEAAQAGREELWPYLLAFLLIALAVETGVAGRL